MTKSNNTTENASSKKVFALVDDLFFAEKIRATAINSGVAVEILKEGEELMQRIKTALPSLVIIDLNGTTTRPMETIQRIRADPQLSEFPILGFFSHVQDELKKTALRAGCNTVLPRSSFSGNLPGILKEGADQKCWLK